MKRSGMLVGNFCFGLNRILQRAWLKLLKNQITFDHHCTSQALIHGRPRLPRELQPVYCSKRYRSRSLGVFGRVLRSSKNMELANVRNDEVDSKALSELGTVPTQEYQTVRIAHHNRHTDWSSQLSRFWRFLTVWIIMIIPYYSASLIQWMHKLCSWDGMKTGYRKFVNLQLHHSQRLFHHDPIFQKSSHENGLSWKKPICRAEVGMGGIQGCNTVNSISRTNLPVRPLRQVVTFSSPALVLWWNNAKLAKRRRTTESLKETHVLAFFISFFLFLRVQLLFKTTTRSERNKRNELALQKETLLSKLKQGVQG